ncbi:hypothetical protein KIL84_009436, partial [Mauremys mutica]
IERKHEKFHYALQEPDSLAQTSKRANHYSVPFQGYEQFYTQSLPSSLVIAAVNKISYQSQHQQTPKDREPKKLDLFGQKNYSTSNLQ